MITPRKETARKRARNTQAGAVGFTGTVQNKRIKSRLEACGVNDVGDAAPLGGIAVDERGAPSDGVGAAYGLGAGLGFSSGIEWLATGNKGMG